MNKAIYILTSECSFDFQYTLMREFLKKYWKIDIKFFRALDKHNYDNNGIVLARLPDGSRRPINVRKLELIRTFRDVMNIYD